MYHNFFFYIWKLYQKLCKTLNAIMVLFMPDVIKYIKSRFLIICAFIILSTLLRYMYSKFTFWKTFSVTNCVAYWIDRYILNAVSISQNMIKILGFTWMNNHIYIWMKSNIFHYHRVELFNIQCTCMHVNA